ncbi:CopG family transcriptional regulator [Brevibacillus parabrevis]|uniref:ribbon-helix-helix domain-containing protein n=1 Tax=Brevibacillus parabrevis TaxID=54914 RepID=UPI0028D4A4BA|nr:CopG family transcriptional regulator [Brevibacillus parabrevis]
MFQRRKRNLDLSGAKGPIRSGQSTHGINWGRDQWQEKGSGTESADDRDLNSGWEEADDESGMEPEHEKFRRHQPKSHAELAYSERQTEEIAPFCHPEPSYPVLQKRPTFYGQNKKLTIYVEKNLLETIETLKKGRYIPSYSWLVAEAIRCYLRVQKIDE